MAGETGDFGPELKTHQEAYRAHATICMSKLASIFTDLNLTSDQYKGEINDTCLAALNVWSSAVQGAETRRQELRSKVETMLAEIASIKAQLGDAHTMPQEASMSS